MSVAPFERFYNVAAEIQVALLPQLDVRNLNDDGVTIEWAVSMSNKSSSDTAEISIYNLHPDDRKRLQEHVAQDPGLPELDLGVALAIGWDAKTETVFAGTASRVEAERPGNIVDVITYIEAFNGPNPALVNQNAGGAAVGQGIILYFAQLAKALGVTVVSPEARGAVQQAASRLPPITFSTVLQGEPEDAMNSLMETLGLSWSYGMHDTDKTIVIYEGGVRNDLLPIIFTYESGLLRFSVQKDGGVQFDALALANCVPGVQVTLHDRDGNTVNGGPMRVERVDFRGSTMRDSTMNVVARKLKPIES